MAPPRSFLVGWDWSNPFFMKSTSGIDPAATLEGLLFSQRQYKRNYKLKVLGSYLFLILGLLLIFSGLQFNIGPFEINFISLDFEFMNEFFSFIAKGIVQTILISAASIVLAVILALLSALARLSGAPIAVAASTFYISLIRGTPLYLQIIFFFLALPQMGIRLSGFWSGVFALGINYGAYMSEIFRAGIQSVGRGQTEAATALGMTAKQRLRLIILPQALRFAIPPIGNQFIAMLKDSALVSITGFVREVLWLAQKVGRQNFRNLEALLMAALLYWILTLGFTALQVRLEKKFSQEGKEGY